ncbi:MAG: diaminopimelate epimerase [Myxococcota bacterium]
MVRLPFVKVEGLGNDFILVDLRSGSLPKPTPAEAIRACHRRRGIGADGVLILESDPEADLRMTVLNCDGSRPEMCGNGLRCVVAHVGRSGAPLTVRTDAGILKGQVLDGGRIRTEIGPLVCTAQRVEAGLEGVPLAGAATAWSAGNPHLVLPVSGDPVALAKEHGPRLESHPAFPDRVNVGFLGIRPDGGWSLAVFERGAGLTSACGTGAAAAACAVMMVQGRRTGELPLHLPGGEVLAELVEASRPEVFAEVSLLGPARMVFRGEWDTETDRAPR